MKANIFKTALIVVLVTMSSIVSANDRFRILDSDLNLADTDTSSDSGYITFGSNGELIFNDQQNLFGRAQNYGEVTYGSSNPYFIQSTNEESGFFPRVSIVDNLSADSDNHLLCTPSILNEYCKDVPPYLIASDVRCKEEDPAAFFERFKSEEITLKLGAPPKKDCNCGYTSGRFSLLGSVIEDNCESPLLSGLDLKIQRTSGDAASLDVLAENVFKKDVESNLSAAQKREQEAAIASVKALLCCKGGQCSYGDPISGNNGCNFAENSLMDDSEDVDENVKEFASLMSRVSLDTIASEGNLFLGFNYEQSYCDKCMGKAFDANKDSQASLADVQKKVHNGITDFTLSKLQADIITRKVAFQRLLKNQGLLPKYLDMKAKKSPPDVRDNRASAFMKMCNIASSLDYNIANQNNLSCGAKDDDILRRSSFLSDGFDNKGALHSTQDAVSGPQPAISQDQLLLVGIQDTVDYLLEHDVLEIPGASILTAGVNGGTASRYSVPQDSAENKYFSMAIYNSYDVLNEACSREEFKDFSLAERTEAITRLMAKVPLGSYQDESTVELIKFQNMKKNAVHFQNPIWARVLENPDYLCEVVKETERNHFNVQDDGPGVATLLDFDKGSGELSDSEYEELLNIENNVCYGGDKKSNVDNIHNLLCGNFQPDLRDIEDYLQNNDLSTDEKLAISKMKCDSIVNNPAQPRILNAFTFDVVDEAQRRILGEDSSAVVTENGIVESENQGNNKSPGSRPEGGFTGAIRTSMVQNGVTSEALREARSMTFPSAKEMIASQEAREGRNRGIAGRVSEATSSSSTQSGTTGEKKYDINKVYNKFQEDMTSGRYEQQRQYQDYSGNSSLTERAVSEVLNQDEDLRDEFQDVAQDLASELPGKDSNSELVDYLTQDDKKIFSDQELQDPDKKRLQEEIDALKAQIAAKANGGKPAVADSDELRKANDRINQLERLVADFTSRDRAPAGNGQQNSRFRDFANPQSLGRIQGGDFGILPQSQGIGPNGDANPGNVNNYQMPRTVAANLVGLVNSKEASFTFDRNKLMLKKGENSYLVDLEDIVMSEGKLKQIVYKGQVISAANLTAGSISAIEEFVKVKAPEVLEQELDNTIAQSATSVENPNPNVTRYVELLCAMNPDHSRCFK